ISLFILISLIGVWRVTLLKKKDELYWLLNILFLPLIVDLILTLRQEKREELLVVSSIFLFLVTYGLKKADHIAGLTNDLLTPSNPPSNKNDNQELVYIILSVWTWSMLQFPFHLTERESDSLLSKHRTDFWSVAEALFIQDGPFLFVRLSLMIRFQIFHQMLVCFTIKNFIVVALNVYRLWVIFWDSR
uniref:Transmembrane protein 26b n=1 Tax=Electrophorus electricus TaxID=8005 RepID=A0AAY5EDC7_ELEEL